MKNSSLSFANHEKPVMTVELEGGTKIFVLPPRKCDISRLETIDKEMRESNDSMGEVYAFLATVLSRNKNGFTFTAKDLEEAWDMDDVIFFAAKYMQFVKSIRNLKNL